jgi:hypothetical protein
MNSSAMIWSLTPARGHSTMLIETYLAIQIRTRHSPGFPELTNIQIIKIFNGDEGSYIMTVGIMSFAIG